MIQVKKYIDNLYYLYVDDIEPLARMFMCNNKLYVIDEETNRIDHTLLIRKHILMETVLVEIQKIELC